MITCMSLLRTKAAYMWSKLQRTTAERRGALQLLAGPLRLS